MHARHIRVGAVQLVCQPGAREANLRHAAGLVEQAAAAGAQLVLLPELMPGGYCLSEAIWDCAEPANGPAAHWLAETAARLQIHVGASVLEADGADFYNTFLLASPQGDIAGRVRKSPPASLEACFYRAGGGGHVIETTLGRIGVGICYENLLFERLRELYQSGIDLLLQPAAAGRPKPIIAGDTRRFDQMVRRIAPYHARALGVPVVLADQAGSLVTPLPFGFGELRSSFPGLSVIVDAQGRVQSRLGEAEGVIVAGVQLDPALKPPNPPPDRGQLWALPVPWYAHMWPETQQMGERAYAQNSRRRQRALAISTPIGWLAGRAQAKS
jgi:N-carbamoylputrescine amidase